jgi:hypothetical protein
MHLGIGWALQVRFYRAIIKHGTDRSAFLYLVLVSGLLDCGHEQVEPFVCALYGRSETALVTDIACILTVLCLSKRSSERFRNHMILIQYL